MNSELRLRPTGESHANGLKKFALTLYSEGRKVKTWIVESGSAGKQVLRTYDDPNSKPGSMEPIPEGVYSVGPIDPAGGKFDWIGSWGPGIGDLWFGIYHSKGDYMRSAFGFHLDENKVWAPGSAGCIVFDTKEEAEDFVEAWRIYSFKRLVVDYGFGTVPSPPVPEVVEVAKPKKKTLEIVAHSGKLRARWSGEPWKDLDSLKISGDYR